MPSSQGRSFLAQWSVWTGPIVSNKTQKGGQNSVHTDDGNAVNGGNGTDVVSRSDGTGNRGFLLLGAVLDALAGEVGGTALACLQANHRLSISVWEERRVGGVIHDGGLGIASSLEGSDNGAAGGDVNSGDSEALLAGIGEELQDIIACRMVNLLFSILSDVGEGCVP